MPSRRSIGRYLDDASLMNLEMVAMKLCEENPENVITIGLDDTTKAAGNSAMRSLSSYLAAVDLYK